MSLIQLSMSLYILRQDTEYVEHFCCDKSNIPSKVGAYVLVIPNLLYSQIKGALKSLVKLQSILLYMKGIKRQSSLLVSILVNSILLNQY